MTRLHLPLAAVLLAGCATAAPTPTSLPVGPHDDPIGSLPDGDVARATVGAYGFSEGLERIRPVIDAPPGSPVARLAVSRALVDALLFGEMTQDGPMLDALVDIGAWDLSLSLLAPDAQDPTVARAQREGRDLIRALRGRAMDEGYHQALRTAVGGVWEVEARIARLLDLEEVMLAAPHVPETGRAQALARILGGVPPDCLESAPVDGVEAARRDVVLVGHCGAEALGWPEAAEAQLYYPGLGAFTSIMGRANSDLRAVLARSAHPLVADARGDVEALGGRMAGLRVAVPLDAEAETDFPFVLATGAGDPLGVRVFVLVGIGGEFRVGVPPLVSVGPSGARFVEAEDGLGFPGALTATGQLASRLGDAEAVLESGRGPAVFLPAKMRVRSAGSALRAIRDALTLGSLGEMMLGFYAPGVGLRGVPLQLALGNEPEEVRATVAADGTISWPEGDLDYVVLVPDLEMPLQVFLGALTSARQRVGTVLVLL